MVSGVLHCKFDFKYNYDDVVHFVISCYNLTFFVYIFFIIEPGVLYHLHKRGHCLPEGSEVLTVGSASECAVRCLSITPQCVSFSVNIQRPNTIYCQLLSREDRFMADTIENDDWQTYDV